MRWQIERIVPKTAAYTIKPYAGDRSATLFTNEGATGSVTITLPAASLSNKGMYYGFEVRADQSFIVAAANAGELVTPGNLAADNVGFQTASKKTGGYIYALCISASKWIIVGMRPGGGFCVNGTEVATDDAVTPGTVAASRPIVPDANKKLSEGLLFFFGAGLVNTFKPEGVLDAQSSVAGVGNGADATDDTLFTYTLKANSLNVNNKRIRIRMCGVTAANGQNKRVKIFIGATAVVDSGVITSNAKNWWAEVTIVRTGVGAQLAFGSFGVDGVADVVTKTTPAADETTDLTVKGTGSSPTSSSANDILGHDWQLEALAF